MRVLADGWYSWVVPEFVPLTDLVARWPRRARAAVLGVGALRGAALFLASTGYDRVAVIRADPGWRSLLLLRGLFGRRRKLVALHYIDHAPRASGRGRLIDPAWQPVERWAVRRAMCVGQVLSPGELGPYTERFAVESGRFVLVPFAWRISPVGSPAPRAEARHGVVAAGRANCDWPTLFAAAGGRGWTLTVVCSRDDREEVLALNRSAGTGGGGATVLVDIAHDRARELLFSVDSGSAVVASSVRGLDGYVQDGVNAVLVGPGEPGALGAAVDRLLSDVALRARLARAAFARAEAWTWDEYLQAVQALAEGRPLAVPPQF